MLLKHAEAQSDDLRPGNLLPISIGQMFGCVRQEKQTLAHVLY